MKLRTYLTAQQIGSTWVVRPISNVGCFSHDGFQEEWTDLLTEIASGQCQNIVLDFSSIAYFGSIILEMVLALGRRLSEVKGRLVICNLSELGREIVHIARFDELWPITDSLEQALALLAEEDSTRK